MEKQDITMKLLIIFMFPLFLRGCMTYGDGMQINAYDETPVRLELVKNIIPGVTTEKEIINWFGDKYFYRLSYDPPLPKPYHGKIYQIDRILFYIKTATETESGPGYSGFHVIGKKQLAIFFKDGKVQFYVVKEETWANNKTTIGKYDNWPRNDPRYSDELGSLRRSGYWPGSFCDIKYYERVATWTLRKNYHVTDFDGIDCEWELIGKKIPKYTIDTFMKKGERYFVVKSESGNQMSKVKSFTLIDKKTGGIVWFSGEFCDDCTGYRLPAKFRSGIPLGYQDPKACNPKDTIWASLSEHKCISHPLIKGRKYIIKVRMYGHNAIPIEKRTPILEFVY